MRKRLVVACLIGCLFSLSARNGYACSCVKLEVLPALREASAVFVGEVIEIVEPYNNNPKAALADRLYAIRFKVDTSWKGTAAEEVVVLSDQGRAGCFSWGPFLKGNKYLVYAGRKTPSGARVRNLVVLFSCNRTSLLKNAGQDIKVLEVARVRAGSKQYK